MQNVTSETEKKQSKPRHSAASAINNLVHRVLDIKHAVEIFVPAAERIQTERLKDVVNSLKSVVALLEDPNGPRLARLRAIKEVSELTPKISRLTADQLPKVVQNGLFLSLFSSFDAFTGDLVRALFMQRPELFSGLQGTLPLESVLAAKSLEALKSQVLDDEIETLRRKSYVEQFAALAQRFEVKLTAFPKWPQFVEASQRRNLLTHCDGIVSDQYIRICREHGVASRELPEIGSTLSLVPKYMLETCDLLIEVAVKLGHTLWRKTIPTDLEAADEHLKDLLYQELKTQSYERAKMLGEFALSLPKLSSDVTRKMIIINYAQALKRSNEGSEVSRLLNGVDWTASLLEFSLAHSVLTEDFARAAALMVTIGPKTEMISEECYHTWPLFLEFTQTEDFAAAYLKLYGYPFFTKVKEDAAATSATAEQSLELIASTDAEIESGLLVEVGSLAESTDVA